ncbi:Sodium-coupled neutral amino acid transporter 9 [Galemys pyrenaicus]|uniref:Neutral amino acid transporter 9 n=1 Tax=Galemys pyrenaicus TaxID=202257 RepID=A0A8J6DU10_GALPY|nr:Sodium-coupled neutral amino acid transporter 9 [Galemys pyrenaicus]
MNKRIHYYSRLTAPTDKALIAPDHVVPAPGECYVYSPLGSAYKLQNYTEGHGKNTSLFYDLEYHDGNIYTKYSLGHKTGWIYYWIVCHLADGPFNTLLLLQSSEITFYDIISGYHYLGISRCLQTLFWLLWAMVKSPFLLDLIHHINDTDAILSTNDSNPVICPSAGSGGHPDNSSMIFYANDTGLQQFEKWWNKSKTVPFYLVGLLLPLLNFKSPSFFSKFNILEIRFQFPQLTGVLTLAFFIHNCIITLLKNNKNQENNGDSPSTRDFKKILDSLDVITQGICTLASLPTSGDVAVSAAPVLTATGNSPTAVRDLSIAYMLVTLTYLYIGILVFASFPSPPLSKDCIEQNFLDNFPSSDILSFIARIFLLFQMMTVYPLLGYLARVQLLGHVFGDIYPSILHVLILNVLIVGAGVIMACFYPNIGGIIRYSGAACGLAFVFLYPSLTYIISLHQEERLTWPKLIFHVFIIILGLANLIFQFFM